MTTSAHDILWWIKYCYDKAVDESESKNYVIDLLDDDLRKWVVKFAGPVRYMYFVVIEMTSAPRCSLIFSVAKLSF
jgi:hypothetical protein